MRSRLTVGLVAIWTLLAGPAAAQNTVQPISALAQAENAFSFNLYWAA
jgi:hypothetical protein